MSPMEKGTTSTARYIAGTTEAMLQERREQILTTNTSDHLDNFISFMEDTIKPENSSIGIIGSQEAFSNAQENNKKVTNSPEFILYSPLQQMK